MKKVDLKKLQVGSVILFSILGEPSETIIIVKIENGVAFDVGGKNSLYEMPLRDYASPSYKLILE